MPLVDTQAAAVAVGVAPSTIRTWADRYPEELPRRGRRGRRTLYELTDVIAVHLKCTERLC